MADRIIIIKPGGSGATTDAGDLTTGTLPDGRFPATLPAVDGSLLTGVTASASSIVQAIVDVAHGFVVGDVLYNAAGTWTKAQADAAATAVPMGVVSTVADVDNFSITYAGPITLSGLSAGSVYYLSAATAGLLTATAPTGVTEFLVPILYAATTTQAYVIRDFPASLALPTVAEGGTGVATLTGYLKGNGTSAFTAESIPLIFAVSDETTDITTGTAKVTFRAPKAMTITAVRASLSTTSSSGTPTVDINEGGTTILSTKLTIDAGEKTSTTAAVAAVISDASIADDAEITIDIDVAGTGAKGLKVYIYYY
jgi:hypothetical protein